MRVRARGHSVGTLRGRQSPELIRKAEREREREREREKKDYPPSE